MISQKFSTLLFATLIFSSLSFSAVSKDSAANDSEHEIKLLKKRLANLERSRAGSRSLRADKSFTVDLGPGVQFGGTGLELSVGYFINESVVLSLSYYNGKDSLDSDYEDKAQVLFAGVKVFTR